MVRSERTLELVSKLTSLLLQVKVGCLYKLLDKIVILICYADGVQIHWVGGGAFQGRWDTGTRQYILYLLEILIVICRNDWVQIQWGGGIIMHCNSDCVLFCVEMKIEMFPFLCPFSPFNWWLQ